MVIKMPLEKTSEDMGDRELLVRIDERVNTIVRQTQAQDIEIDSLKTWKDRTIGGLTIVFGLSGYSILF